MNNITVGVDISKLKFDVCYKDKTGKLITKSLDNNQEGFKALSAMLAKDEAVSLGMEATGNYGYALADYMYSSGASVYVINPALIKYYGKSLNFRTKTDKQDSKLIHSFLCTHMGKLHVWKPLSKSYRDFRALNRCLENLKGEQVKFNNMIDSELCVSVQNVYENILESLASEVKTVVQELKEVIASDAKLQATFGLLLTIPGIGEITAWNLLAELPEITGFKNAKQLAAYAGLNPAIKQSGTSVYGRGSISKVGSSLLRKSLYFPAMSALRYNPCVKTLGERLKAKGKNGKVIIVAAMHKLLRIVFAILKSGVVFNPAIHKA